jgi:hypothetical protein
MTPPSPRRQSFATWLKNHPQANNYETLWLIQNVLATVYQIKDPQPVEAWLASDHEL